QCCFFFSSRRRHTRFKCDWSSDVCSSDLANALHDFGNGGTATASSFVTDKVNDRADDIFTGGGSKDTLGIQQGKWLSTAAKPQRSEERRVGKECRSRWSPEHTKRKKTCKT